MRLYILSDIHNEFSVFTPPAVAADMVILAGDIDLKGRAIEWMRQFKTVLYVAGNHEFYGEHLLKMREKLRQAAASPVHFLDDDELIVDGVRFLGGTLWTDFALYGEARRPLAMWDGQMGLNDYHRIRTDTTYRKLRPADTWALHMKTVAFLETKRQEPFAGKTVVVTHHAPSPRSIHPAFANDPLSPCFASNLEHLMGPPIDLWIHGHTHNSSDYTVNGTRVIANPRGYQRPGDTSPENPDFNPGLVVDI